MTQEEFLIKQRKVLNSIIKDNNPLKIAARTIHKDVTVRVFEKGLKSDGSNIGQYDTKRPLYVYPNLSPRATGVKTASGLRLQGLLPTRGKPGAYLTEDPEGEHTFTEKTAHRGAKGTQAGDVHKMTYVKNYKDFRNRIGRRIDKVNLVLSGDLQSDFANGKISNPTPKKVNAHEYIVTLTRQVNMDKREGLEDKYGEIFAHTLEEQKKFVAIAEKEFRNEFSKAGL